MINQYSTNIGKTLFSIENTINVFILNNIIILKNIIKTLFCVKNIILI